MTFFYALPSISIASCTILVISALLVKVDHLLFVPCICAVIKVLQLVCTLVYRVTYHPLARFPGPFLAKFTDFYAAYHAYTGDFHLDIHRCHERYGTFCFAWEIQSRIDCSPYLGDFVRYGPNRILVNSSQGMHGTLLLLAEVKHALIQHDLSRHLRSLEKCQESQGLSSYGPWKRRLEHPYLHRQRNASPPAKAYIAGSLGRFAEDFRARFIWLSGHLLYKAWLWRCGLGPLDPSKECWPLVQMAHPRYHV